MIACIAPAPFHSNNLFWSDETELLLKEWSEKASCFRWLHSRCEKKYRFRYYCFSIPVIILSTLSGTANFGMDSFVPENAKPTASGHAHTHPDAICAAPRSPPPALSCEPEGRTTIVACFSACARRTPAAAATAMS